MVSGGHFSIQDGNPNQISPMKIGLTSYPMLWQRSGGLQIQILQTERHLRALGIDARVLNPLTEKMNEYDIIHVFATIHGVHTILQEAKRQGCITVLSPIMQIDTPLSRFRWLRFASWLTGVMSRYENKTTYDHVKSALKHADLIVALSEKEQKIVTCGYGSNLAKTCIISNGVDAQFFTSDEPSEVGKYITSQYVLVVGSITPYKNQLGVIRSTSRQVVLVGPVFTPDYLTECLDAGQGRVTYVGHLDHSDPQLRSIYARAAVTVLASEGEAFGLCIVESLACGTPAIVTVKNGLGILPIPPRLQFVKAQDSRQLHESIELACQATNKDRLECRKLVEHLQWPLIAEALIDQYEQLLILK